MDISFPTPLLLPFSCTMVLFREASMVPAYERPLQNKDSHGQNFAGQFSIFIWKTSEKKKKCSEIALWDSLAGSGKQQGMVSQLSRGVVATEKSIWCSRRGLKLSSPRQKYHCTAPIAKRQTTVFCVQRTVLSKSGSRGVWHKLFAVNQSGERAVPTSDNMFQTHVSCTS